MRVPATRPPLRRMQWLDATLRDGRKVSLADLCAEFEISPRTAYRDVDFLRDQLDAPVEYDRRRKTYYYSDPTFSLPAIAFSEGELVALLLAEKVLRQYQGTRYAENLQAAFAKLCAALPDEVTLDLGGLGDALTFDLGPARSVDVEVYGALWSAVRERRRLEITYYTQSRDEVTVRQVDPLHLHAVAGDLYLIAFCHRRGEVRDFAVSRIRGLVETGERFRPPAGFDREAYLHQGFGVFKGGEPQEVSLCFDAYQARWIRERCWHPTQRIEEQPGGGLVLYLTVPVSDDLLRWVLSYGSHCRVVGPGELREGVGKEVAKMRE